MAIFWYNIAPEASYGILAVALKTGEERQRR
jgi:hypothetical protein